MTSPNPVPARAPRSSSRTGPLSRTAISGEHSTQTRDDLAGVVNTRARLVGARTGVLADIIVLLVRVGRVVGAAIARVFRRIAAVITPLGWVMLGVIPISLLVGYRLGWIELVVAGWACVVLVVVAAVYLVGRSPFTVKLSLPHRRVVMGEVAHGRIAVLNPHRRRTLGVKVEIPVGAGLAELAMPGLRGGGVYHHDFAIPTLKRGIVSVGPVRTVRADPIGLVRREVVWTDAEELIVHPKTIGVPSSSTGLIRRSGGHADPRSHFQRCRLPRPARVPAG